MPKDGKKTAIIVGVGVAAVAGVILLTAGKKPLPGLANLHGQVIDADTGTPLAGVLIALNGYSAFTGPSGRYEFTDLEPGEYMVEFSKEGYLTEVF